MSATLTGLDAFTQKAEAVASAIEQQMRGIASGAAQRMAAGVRARVRFKTGKHLRNQVAVIEHAAQRHFLVGFKDVTEGADGHPMVPVWHEFGTEKMPANPAVGDSVAAERKPYESEMKSALTRILESAR